MFAGKEEFKIAYGVKAQETLAKSIEECTTFEQYEVLAYLLAGPVGEAGIWLAIPIGWALADLTGFAYYARHRAALLPPAPTAAVINLK